MSTSNSYFTSNSNSSQLVMVNGIVVTEAEKIKRLKLEEDRKKRERNSDDSYVSSPDFGYDISSSSSSSDCGSDSSSSSSSDSSGGGCGSD